MTFLFVMLTFCTASKSTIAQVAPNSRYGSAFDQGVFQKRKAPMNGLLRLKLIENGIGFDRNWGPANRTVLIDQEIEKLMDRGMDRRIAGKLAEQLVPTGFNTHPLSKAFAHLRGGPGSFGHSGSTQGWNTHFRDSDMSAKLKFSSRKIDLTIRELKSPKRRISVEDDNNGTFELIYSGNDFEIRLSQSNDTGIELEQRTDGSTKSWSAESFLELQKEEPELVDEFLFPVLAHAGFEIPVTVTSPIVQRAVLSRLSDIQGRSKAVFEQLLDDLESENFATREKASEKIGEEINVWYDRVLKSISSEKLSAEGRNRLSMILNRASNRTVVDNLISQFDLTRSPEYLASLFLIAEDSDKESLNRQLKKITGKSFTTASQWNKYLLEDSDGN